MMTDPDAMIALTRGGSASSVNLRSDFESDDRYERLFGLRDVFAQTNVDFINQKSTQGEVDNALRNILAHLTEHFNSDMSPFADDREMVREIVAGLLISSPVYYTDRQIDAVHDIVVNIGIMRNIMYSYSPKISDEFQQSDEMVEWLTRVRPFF